MKLLIAVESKLRNGASTSSIGKNKSKTYVIKLNFFHQFIAIQIIDISKQPSQKYFWEISYKSNMWLFLEFVLALFDTSETRFTLYKTVIETFMK